MTLGTGLGTVLGQQVYDTCTGLGTVLGQQVYDTWYWVRYSTSVINLLSQYCT